MSIHFLHYPTILPPSAATQLPPSAATFFRINRETFFRSCLEKNMVRRLKERKNSGLPNKKKITRTNKQTDCTWIIYLS